MTPSRTSTLRPSVTRSPSKRRTSRTTKEDCAPAVAADSATAIVENRASE
jgi:hypothetical protein